jgi:hypothetical protein
MGDVVAGLAACADPLVVEACFGFGESPTIRLAHGLKRTKEQTTSEGDTNHFSPGTGRTTERLGTSPPTAPSRCQPSR